jgi:hypothetical protein
MRNRFIMRIKSGEIGSVSALKTEFKILAKSHHPDLRGSGEAFVGLHEEYEIALRNFELHRFGFRPPDGAAALDPRRLYATLSDLLKRGFPKMSRHEKEKQRYEYLRYLARAQANALRPSGGDSFEAFERELLGLRTESPPLFRQAMRLLADIIEYSKKPLAGLAAANALDYAALERQAGRASPLSRFFALLLGLSSLE